MRGKFIAVLIGALLLYSGASSVYNGILKDKIEEVKVDRDKYKNNSKAFENLAQGYFEENRVIRFNRDDLKNSNNKLIHTIDSIKKSRKTPENKPGGVSTGVSTTIHDTVEIEIQVPMEVKVDTLLKFNEMTTVGVKIEKKKLSAELTVNNTQVLNVFTSREYVNEYKNRFRRFLHLDYKKEDVERYTIDNTNKLIKVTDAIVIKHE